MGKLLIFFGILNTLLGLLILAVVLITDDVSQVFLIYALFVILTGILNIAAAVYIKRLRQKMDALPAPAVRAAPVPPAAAPAAPVKTIPRVDDMSGKDFESFCVRLLEAYGFYHLEQTPASGDHGVDILGWKSGKKYAIQCKRYKNTVGNKAVQEVYTGKQLYAASEAVVLTSSYFSPQAVQEAADIGVTLWDRDALKHIMDMADINDVKL